MNYGSVKLLQVEVTSIIMEIELQIAAACKSIGVNSGLLERVLNEDLVVTNPPPPEWRATISPAVLAGVIDARKALNQVLQSSTIADAADIENVVKKEASN